MAEKNDRAPVIRLSEPYPGDAEASQAVIDALEPILQRLLERLGPHAILDGIGSIYVSLAIGWLGEAQALDAARRYMKAIPRIAAAQRARRGAPGGRA
jgi:glutathione S-transferase